VVVFYGLSVIFALLTFGCPISQSNNPNFVNTGIADGISYGLSSHVSKDRYVDRFNLSVVLMIEKDHFIFDI
jgi:hypothetical protein